MASLDSFLNVAIPIGVILAFIGLMYWKMSEPFNFVFKFLGKMFGSAGDGLMSIFQTKPVTEVIYK